MMNVSGVAGKNSDAGRISAKWEKSFSKIYSIL